MSAGRRILVVDDNVDMAKGLARLLERDGHEVHMAYDGASGFDALRRRPDVALLDIGSPGMDGYELARRIRAVDGLKSIRLLAITGYGSEQDRVLSRDAGFDHHLVKPVDHEVLLRLLGDPQAD